MRAIVDRIRPHGPSGALEVAVRVEDDDDVFPKRSAEIIVYVQNAAHLTVEQIRSRAFVQAILFLSEAARLRSV
jgi:hypothetical protein